MVFVTINTINTNNLLSYTLKNENFLKVQTPSIFYNFFRKTKNSAFLFPFGINKPFAKYWNPYEVIKLTEQFSCKLDA